MNAQIITIGSRQGGAGPITRATRCKTAILLFAALLFCLLFTTRAQSAQLQKIEGHVPAAIARLQPLHQLPSTNILHLVIGLPLRNQSDLTTLLQQLYDPDSPQYRHYLTPDQFTERFGPTPQDYLAVSNYAVANGFTVTGTHPNRTLLDISAPVPTVEKAFHVTFHVYQHPKEARTFFAPDTNPTLDLAVPILHIGGLDNYVLPRPVGLTKKKTRPGGKLLGSGPGGSYFGNDFRNAYAPGVTLDGTRQIVALVEFDGYYPGDIAAYEAAAGLTNVTLINVPIDGGVTTPGNGNDEVALDIEMAVAMAPGLSSVMVYEAPTDPVVDGSPAYIYDTMNRIATDNLAKQISASWVFRDDVAINNVFLQYATQGQSYFLASGDEDAYTPDTFQWNDDPYITLVGGTTLSSSGPHGSYVSESAWNWGGGSGTGGGISTNYVIPSWQQPVSMAFNGGSVTMRNIPDVALTADNIWVYASDGTTENLGGTSCAAPLWAGFMALVNQQGVANGAGTVGFLNPIVYTIGLGPAYTNAFHDVALGDNTWSESPNAYYAVPGYDLCTGWGSPNGSGLINLLAPNDVLRVSPINGFTSIGGHGGPFNVTSQIYTLSNSGPSTLNWKLGSPATWLNLSPSNGTLPSGTATTPFTASLNTAASNLVVGTYNSPLWITNLNDGVAQLRLFTLQVIAPPTITNSPASQGALQGQNVRLTVGAKGDGTLTWRWRDNGTNLADIGNINGSATATLSISNFAPANAGSYSVVVGNQAGGVTSSPPAVLSFISSKPVIIAQPASQFAIVGGTVQLNVSAIGNQPLHYQWYYNNGLMSGDTSPSLLLPGVTTNQSGTYDVVITNSLGAVTSSNAVLTVLPPSIVLNGGFETGDFTDWTDSGNVGYDFVSPDPPYVHSGSYGAVDGPFQYPAYLTQNVPTTAGQTYLISLWVYCDGFAPNEFNVSWDNHLIFDQVNMGATLWTNIVLEAGASTTSTPLSFGFRNDPSYFGLDDVAVYPAPPVQPVITGQPASQTATLGGPCTFQVIADGTGPLSYFWYRNNAIIPGANASSYTVNPVQPPDSSSRFSCLVSNAFGTVMSSQAVLSISESLVQNGGFETGDFTAWDQIGDFTYCTVVSFDPYVHSGFYGAFLSTSGSQSYLSQSIPTAPGQPYLISCWVFCDGTTPNEFSASWNGTTIYDQPNLGNTLWTNFQFQVTAQYDTTPLTLGFRDDNSFLGLDDIVVNQVVIGHPVFQQALIVNGQINLVWDSQPGLLYQVQYATNLSQKVWFNLSGEILLNSTSISISDAVTNTPARYYRLVAAP